MSPTLTVHVEVPSAATSQLREKKGKEREKKRKRKGKRKGKERGKKN